LAGGRQGRRPRDLERRSDRPAQPRADDDRQRQRRVPTRPAAPAVLSPPMHRPRSAALLALAALLPAAAAAQQRPPLELEALRSGSPARFALRASRILTLDDERSPVVDDGLLLVEAGRIVAVGARGEIELAGDVPLVGPWERTRVPGFGAAHP